MLWLSRSFSCCPSPSSCWLELIADGSDRPKLSTNSSSEKEGEARQCGRMAWALGMPYASAALLHGWWWWRQKQLREERGGHGHPIRCLGARSSPLRVSSLWQAWEGGGERDGDAQCWSLRIKKTRAMGETEVKGVGGHQMRWRGSNTMWILFITIKSKRYGTRYL
jgi:hypothetical protein